ncbi:MAG TPA: hypothetical protein VLA56_08820 [Pseudomonadales bacterium]|nr:hypothetical protein [Pseudomonadales bacterium]
MTMARLLCAAVLLAGLPLAHADHHEAAALQAAIDAADRSEADRERDAGRKPAEVLAFLGIGEGMAVIDVIAAGGWYTEVLAAVVGEDGLVYAQNPAAVLKFRDGANDKALTARLADGRLPNVERLDHELSDLGLRPGTLDAAITALNFHDVYNAGPDAAAGMLQAVKNVLRPGGVFGIIDHVGVAGADNAALHRIEKQKVIDAALAAGFEIAGDSDLLANPDDDHSQGVFAAGLRGHTDRFLLKLVKPG